MSDQLFEPACFGIFVAALWMGPAIIVLIAAFPFTLVHELSHLAIGRHSGLQVLRISFGAAGWTVKRIVAGVVVSIRLPVLLGGRTDFLGEDIDCGRVPDDQEAMAFSCASHWTRARVAGAGLLASVLSTLPVCAFLLMAELGLPEHERSPDLVLSVLLSSMLKFKDYWIASESSLTSLAISSWADIRMLGWQQYILLASLYHPAIAVGNCGTFWIPKRGFVKTDGYYVWRWVFIAVRTRAESLCRRVLLWHGRTRR